MRGEKNFIGVEGFDKSDRIHYKGKIALTYKKRKRWERRKSCSNSR